MEGIFPEVNLFIFGRKASGWGGGGGAIFGIFTQWWPRSGL